jgi:hypothetical protein
MVLVHEFRQNPQRQFFLAPAKGSQAAPKKDTVRTMVIAMRKQNLSIYDISHVLSTKGYAVSPVSVSNILKEEGCARLPRRKDDERLAGTRPTVADVADVRQLDLSPHKTYLTLPGLQYSTGMRIGEATALNLQDVHPKSV